MMIKLQDVFVLQAGKWRYTKEVLFELPLHKAFIRRMTEQLHLSYLENNGQESNLCFANEKDLHPAYRATFSKVDVINYSCTFLQKEPYDLKEAEIPFPPDLASFWVENQSNLGHPEF